MDFKHSQCYVMKAKKVEYTINTFMYFDLAQKRRLTLLDLLITSFQKGLLTDSDIKDEVNTFMFAVCFCKFSWSFRELFEYIYKFIWRDFRVMTLRR